jgi:excisionase family DNA binding protein
MVKEIGNIRVFTIEDLSEGLSVNPRVVREWLKEGKIVGKKVGRRWLVTEDSLKKFLEGGDTVQSKKKMKTEV